MLSQVNDDVDNPHEGGDGEATVASPNLQQEGRQEVPKPQGRPLGEEPDDEPV